MATEVQKLLHMNGGDGETSYAKNSYAQKEILEAVRSVVQEAVVELYDAASFSDKLSIADLGCSSGPNALSIVTDVVDTVLESSRRLGRPPPEFQVFVNDLPGNDFNSVFRSLQAFYEQREVSGGGRELGCCFVAGVPGSFHGRLFQSRSIHFFRSSSSLNWLSQDPLRLRYNDVPLNKRNIYISKESPAFVVNAYSTQFGEDFSNFLKFRSEEMVTGGRMVLILIGRKTLDLMNTPHWTLLTQVLLDMVQEGYIAEEKVNSFHLPYYLPCATELEHEIQREGSFSLKCLRVFEVDVGARQDHDNPIKYSDIPINIIVKRQTSSIRAAVESLLASHFGDDIIEELFLRYNKALQDDAARIETKVINLVISLIRKP